MTPILLMQWLGVGVLLLVIVLLSLFVVVTWRRAFTRSAKQQSADISQRERSEIGSVVD